MRKCSPGPSRPAPPPARYFLPGVGQGCPGPQTPPPELLPELLSVLRSTRRGSPFLQRAVAAPPRPSPQATDRVPSPGN